MTIETGSKPNGVRTAAADTRNHKNKPAASDSPGGGFGAILASMDSSEMVAQPVADAVDANVSAKVVAVSTTATTTQANLPVNSLLTPNVPLVSEMNNGLDELALAEPEVPPEFGETKKLLLEDALGALPIVTPPIVDAAVFPTPPMDVMASGTQATQWPPSNLQNGQSEGRHPSVSTAQVGLGSIKPVQTSVKPEGVLAAPLALHEPLETPSMPGKLLRDAAAKQVQMGDVLSAKEPPAGREVESRSLQLTAKSFDQTTLPIAVTLAATSSMMPVRREDQTRDRMVFRSNATEGSTFGQSFLSTGVSTAVQYTPEIQMSPDVYIAEKVAYWISNDVQNAEMKLDGIGLDPVEVSIRMHGNEAHVAFRTDELQARAALENASTHLKELLQREGLVLTGVSVGTSGAGDSGNSDGKSRPGTRQANVSGVSQASARSGPVAGRTAGGRLDLFV